MADDLYRYPSGRVAHRLRDPTVTFCLAAPFDEVCRSLGPHYLAAAWSGLRSVLERHGLDPHACELGWGHAGVMANPRGEVEESPFTGVGWLLPEREAGSRPAGDPPGDWLPIWDVLDRELRALEVPLHVARHGYRSSVVRSATGERLPLDDPALALAVWCEHALDDISDWSGWGGDAPAGLWGDCARAIWTRGWPAFEDGLAAVLGAYSSAGAELVVRGFTRFLTRWVDDDMPHAGADPPPGGP